MADTITYQTGSNPLTPPTYTVYLRASWADAWVAQPYLYVDRVVWAAAPSMPSAILSWRYGPGMHVDDLSFQTYQKLDITRQYVKIEFTHGDFPTTNVWYGIIETVGDEMHGTDFSTGVGVARGKQTFVAYGLEILLDRVSVTGSVFTTDNFDLVLIDRAIDFNSRGLGNATTNIVGTTRVFDSTAGNELDISGTFWSSFDIVDYLLTYWTPTDAVRLRTIFWKVDPIGSFTIPTWDRPVVQAHGRRPLELINAIIARQRLLSFYVTVDENDNKIVLVPFSFNVADIAINGNTFNRNQNTKVLVFDEDASAICSLTQNDIDRFDAVVVRGARVRTMFNLSIDDGTLEAGWTSAQETAYENAASGAGDYPAAAEIAGRARRNKEARAAESLSEVFARFKIPDNWDRKAGNGLGTGTMRPIDPDPSFVLGGVSLRLYRPEIFILNTLPLLEKHDYTDDKIPAGTVTHTGTGPFAELSPIVCVPVPEDTNYYVQAENVGSVADMEITSSTVESDRAWSASVSVKPRDRAIWVKVHGQDQHVIAKTDFAGLGASHGDTVIDRFDWRDFIFVVALESDRYALGIAPLLIEPSEIWRILYIDAGDQFRLDYVVPDTIVNIKATDGTIEYSDGGYVRDDTPALLDLASLAYEWYKQTRTSFEFTTSIFKPFTTSLGCGVGDLVTDLGEQSDALDNHVVTANAVITQIEYSIPRSDSAETGPMRINYTAQFGELDPLRL